jgi:hypothetical protein
VATTRRPAANSSPQFIAGIVYRHVFGVVDGVDSLGVGQQQESWQRAPIYIFVRLVFYGGKDVQYLQNTNTPFLFTVFTSFSLSPLYIELVYIPYYF